MKFPVLHGKQNNFPSEPDSNCPVCQSKQVWGSNEYVELSGGSHIETSQNVEYDLWLDWFSAENGQAPQVQTELTIVSEVLHSRFQLAFCSTNCLRQFLNSAVDQLEQRINEQKTHNK